MTSNSILDLFLVLNLLISASTSLKLDYSINSVHSLLRSRKSNCTDIISHFIQRSAIYCPQIVLNPFSLAEARQLDLARHSCQLNGRLECIPMIVRDSIDVVGMATTGGLSSLRNSYPEQDAELIARLRSEGAIVVAKSSDLITNNSCVNPFDKEASYFHESNAPIATSIAVGAAIIGIGFDSDGLAQVSSSLNHVNSIRLPQNLTSNIGIFPSFEKQDSVVLMSKHSGDIHRIIDILSSSSNETEVESSSLLKQTALETRVGVFKFMLLNLTMPTSNGQIYQYVVDRPIKVAVERAIRRLKSLKVKLIEYNLSPIEVVRMMYSMSNKSKNMLESVEMCRKQEAKDSIDRYLRHLGYDAPYKSIEALVRSPNLPDNTKNEFRSTIQNEPTNENEQSSDKCEAYESAKIEFEQFVSDWFNKDDLDSILIPTYLQTTTNSSFMNSFNTSVQSLASLGAYSSYPAINIPVGFSQSDFPVGILLISRPESWTKSMCISKLYEGEYGEVINNLPRSTPELNNAIIIQIDISFIFHLLSFLILNKLMF